MRKINLKKASFLKRLGWTHKEIAKEMNCSVIWCGKNLAHIERDSAMIRKVYHAYLCEQYLDLETKEEIVPDQEDILFGD